MSEPNDEQPAAIHAELSRRLPSLGLAEGRDFFVRAADDGSHYVIVDLTFKESLTSPLLEQCAASHGEDWGILVGAFDPEVDNVCLMVEVSGGGFSYIAGGDAVHNVVTTAYQLALARRNASG